MMMFEKAGALSVEEIRIGLSEVPKGTTPPRRRSSSVSAIPKDRKGPEV